MAEESCYNTDRKWEMKQDLTKQQIRAAACEIRKMPRASEKNYYEEEHHLRRAFHYRVRVTQ